MRGTKRKISQSGCQHIYQNTRRGTLLFYSDEDRIVFTTLFTVLKRKYGITVLSLTLMYNHIHFVPIVPGIEVMAKFNGELESKYALAFNRDCGRKGPLFNKAYGNSPKNGDKLIRTTLAYSFNNSVEKYLYSRAEDDRWTFLAYLKSKNPFSEAIDLTKASRPMRARLSLLKALSKQSVPLSYTYVRKLFSGLTAKEARQMTDAIISEYLPIDPEPLLHYYRSYENMLIAINSNTGSEYNLKEDFDDPSHTFYREMLSIISRSSFADNPKRIVTASASKKKQIADILARETGARYGLIRRVLDM